MALRNGWPDLVLGAEYPFQDHHVRLADGHSIHYIEQGSAGLRRPTFLLVPGAPAWSYLYRRIVPQLARVGRVVAVDPLGLGRSDHPADPALYTLEERVRQLGEFSDQLGLKRVVPVLHGLSCAAGLGHAVERKDELQGIVILNGWVPGVPLAPLGRFRSLLALAGIARVGAAERAERAEPKLEEGELSENVRAGYAHPFPTADSKAGLRILAQHPVTGDKEARRRVADRIAMLETPTLVVWGVQDQVLGRETAFRVAGRFRRAGKPVFVEDAGHWLPEQRPERVAAEIESFSQGW